MVVSWLNSNWDGWGWRLGDRKLRRRARTKIKGKVTNGHQSHGGWSTWPAADAKVDTTGDEKEDTKDEERPCQPLPTGEAVGSKDEGGAASNGGQRDGQEVLLGLLDEHVVDGVAGLCGICLPRW